MNKLNINMMSGVVAAVLFVLSMVVLGTADADNWSNNYARAKAECDAMGGHACENPILKQGTKHWVNPNHGNGSIGSCSKDGKFCWNITIGNDGYNHYPTFPVEFHGAGARHLIANGQIEFANMNGFGVFYLGVRSSYDGRPYDCTVNVSRRTYHCISHNY